MGSGHYRDPYLDRDWFDRTSVDEIADLIVRDLEEGVDETGIRAGIIGEIGADKWYISAAEERSFRAAARAHLRTGITITTHAARWPIGIPQLDILQAEGVDPRRVIIGHCDMVPIPEYHEAIAQRGAFVEFDTIRGESEYDVKIRVAFVKNLIEKGFTNRILLSHDVCLRSLLSIFGGCGYDYIFTTFLPLLLDAGVGEDEVRQITVLNPRDALVRSS
jgi:phosphotriesterase-related protein